MDNQTYYEYDRKRQVLIELSPNGSPRIIKKGEHCWRSLGPDDDRYARAIYQGQGCWEDLITITGEEGERILEEWGESVRSKGL